MLRKYKAETGGQGGETGEGKNKGKDTAGLNRPTLKPKLAEAEAKIERLLPVGQAAGKFAEAVQASDKAKKEEAQKELLFTVDASPARGLDADDQPNGADAHELLAEIQRIRDRIFTVAPTLVRLANAQIKRLQLQGKIGFLEQEKPKPEAPKPETPPDSINSPGCCGLRAVELLPPFRYASVTSNDS